MSKTQRIDDIINGLEPRAEDSKPEISEAEQEADGEATRLSEAPEKEDGKESHKSEPKEDDSKDNQEPESELKADTDEYGLEAPKERVYTESQVQEMMRERFKRGHHATPQQQAQVQQAAEGFTADPNNPDSWESQLEQFVEKTIDKVTEKSRTKAWQQEEHEKQAKFETNFSMGMEKYSDFREVAGKVNVTNSMLMAIRDMDNPATFIYAAAKLQPKELERIAAINDPFQQAKEMGRLDERMRKAKHISRTAVPLKPTTGDIGTVAKVTPKKNIDSIIQSHAKSKQR